MCATPLFVSRQENLKTSSCVSAVLIHIACYKHLSPRWLKNTHIALHNKRYLYEWYFHFMLHFQDHNILWYQLCNIDFPVILTQNCHYKRIIIPRHKCINIQKHTVKTWTPFALLKDHLPNQSNSFNTILLEKPSTCIQWQLNIPLHQQASFTVQWTACQNMTTILGIRFNIWTFPWEIIQVFTTNHPVLNRKHQLQTQTALLTRSPQHKILLTKPPFVDILNKAITPQDKTPICIKVLIHQQ